MKDKIVSSKPYNRNEIIVFGGETQKRQISKLIDCRLKNIGQLNFDHAYGACANIADQLIYLCFNWNETDRRKCRFGLYPRDDFQEIDKSVHNHDHIRLGASESEFS